MLSVALLLRVPQSCTGRAQKGCFWLAAGCLHAPGTFHPGVPPAGGGWHGGCALLLLKSVWPEGMGCCVRMKAKQRPSQALLQSPPFSCPGAGCGGSPVMDHASPAAAAVCLRPLRSTSRFTLPSSPLLSDIRVALHSSCLFKR